MSSALIKLNKFQEICKSLQRASVIVICTMYNVHCTMYTIQCILYNVQCILYNVQCILYNVQCILYNVNVYVNYYYIRA